MKFVVEANSPENITRPHDARCQSYPVKITWPKSAKLRGTVVERILQAVGVKKLRGHNVLTQGIYVWALYPSFGKGIVPRGRFCYNAAMNILIVEDDRKLAAMMAKAFAENGFATVHALDGSEGFLREKTGHFDVVVTDVMMPNMDGFALIKAIRATGDNVPIIVLSAKSDVTDRVRGLEYGADDYLAKPFSITELMARVQAVLRRVAGRSDPEALVADELRLDLMTRKLTVRGQVVELQPLELKLVDYLLRNRGRVVSRSTILEHVWDYSFDPHTNVVECRVSRLRAKLGQRSDGSPFIRTVKGFGYAID